MVAMIVGAGDEVVAAMVVDVGVVDLSYPVQ